jgi:hypothetical protein
MRFAALTASYGRAQKKPGGANRPAFFVEGKAAPDAACQPTSDAPAKEAHQPGNANDALRSSARPLRATNCALAALG